MSHSYGGMPWAISIIAGGTAGGVEAAVTVSLPVRAGSDAYLYESRVDYSQYPFEFVKTRVQLRSQRGVKSPSNPFAVIANVWRSDGVRAMYRGCPALLAGSVAKDAIRFSSFDTIKDIFADAEIHTLTPFRSMFAGMVSGVIASTTVVTPTERIKTVLIDDARSEKVFPSTLQAVQTIYAGAGFRGLYKGYVATTLKQVGATTFRLGTYNILNDYSKSRGVKPGVALSFAYGAMAGTVTVFATQPFEMIKTRSQSGRGMSAVAAAKTVFVDEGIRGFWRGSTMRLGRTVLSGGILFTVYEQIVRLLKPSLRPCAD